MIGERNFYMTFNDKFTLEIPSQLITINSYDECHLKIIQSQDAYAIIGYPAMYLNLMTLDFENKRISFERTFSGDIPNQPISYDHEEGRDGRYNHPIEEENEEDPKEEDSSKAK